MSSPTEYEISDLYNRLLFTTKYADAASMKRCIEKLGYDHHDSFEAMISGLTDKQLQIVFDSYDEARQPTHFKLPKPYFYNILPSNVGYRPDAFREVSKSHKITEGLSPEQILTSPFFMIRHEFWELDMLAPILQSGSLSGAWDRASIEDLQKVMAKKLEAPDFPKTVGVGFAGIRLDQYPGVYAYLDFVDYNGKPPPNFSVKADFTFVISLALLKKKGWHLNGEEEYGSLLGDKTWTYKTLPSYLEKGIDIPAFGELVLHYPIPLEYVECLVYSDKYEKEVLNIVAKSPYFNLETIKKSEFLKDPFLLAKRVKGLYKPGTYDSSEPDLCYDSLGANVMKGLSTEDILAKYSDQDIKNILKECGFSDPIIRDAIKGGKLSALKIIFGKWMERRLARRK